MGVISIVSSYTRKVTYFPKCQSIPKFKKKRLHSQTEHSPDTLLGTLFHAQKCFNSFWHGFSIPHRFCSIMAG